MITQHLDGVSFRLKEPFDFGFVTKYGRVFQVFDGQDSGNLCFGVEKAGLKFFVKFAGASTAEYPGNPADAVFRLKAIVPIYQDLYHPNLVNLRFAEEIGGGYAAVFDWVEADCMGKQYPASRDRFFRLPADIKLSVYNDILYFLQHILDKGYMPIDFYDGSILYDPAAGKGMICDIDCFLKQPVVNTTGRMWGSSRFMSPEEFQLGAAVDELSTVFLAGATAFALFGGELDRSVEKWKFCPGLHKVALKAVSPERSLRQSSLREYRKEWELTGESE